MNTLRILAAGMMVCALSVSASADDKKEKPDYAKLLVGKWEVTKCSKDDDVPVGTLMEFGKDGTIKITVKNGGKEMTVNAIYKVEGDKIQYTLKLDKDLKKDPITIKKLTEQELVLDGSSIIECKRIK